MTMQHITIPLQPYTEPQRLWMERSAAAIDRYLDATYGDEPDARALDSMFLHVAADVIWDVAPSSPDWRRLSVMRLLLYLANAPCWDEAFLLHACAAVAAFYRWLTGQGLVRQDEIAAILDDLDRRIAETLASLGVGPSVLAN